MPLNSHLQSLLDRSVDAAYQAGRCIMSYYGSDLTIASKGLDSHTGDVVTEVDHAAQDLILDTLYRDGAGDPLFRNVAILAEEMPDYDLSLRFDRDFSFLIDPLDGTRGFLDRNNSFAVSIGLIRRDGTPVFGVAYLPAYDRCYVGIHRESATVNGKPIQLPSMTRRELVLWLSEAEIFPTDNNRMWHRIIDRIKTRTAIEKTRPACLGSPVHKGCQLVSSDRPALYLGLPRKRKGVSLWDLAAIAPLVTGAGGWVSDVWGQPLELNRREQTFVHHRGFLFSTHRDIAEAVIQTFHDHPEGWRTA